MVNFSTPSAGSDGGDPDGSYSCVIENGVPEVSATILERNGQKKTGKFLNSLEQLIKLKEWVITEQCQAVAFFQAETNLLFWFISDCLNLGEEIFYFCNSWQS